MTRRSSCVTRPLPLPRCPPTPPAAAAAPPPPAANHPLQAVSGEAAANSGGAAAESSELGKGLPVCGPLRSSLRIAASLSAQVQPHGAHSLNTAIQNSGEQFCVRVYAVTGLKPSPILLSTDTVFCLSIDDARRADRHLRFLRTLRIKKLTEATETDFSFSQ